MAIVDIDRHILSELVHIQGKIKELTCRHKKEMAKAQETCDEINVLMGKHEALLLHLVSEVKVADTERGIETVSVG